MVCPLTVYTCKHRGLIWLKTPSQNLPAGGIISGLASGKSDFGAPEDSPQAHRSQDMGKAEPSGEDRCQHEDSSGQ